MDPLPPLSTAPGMGARGYNPDSSPSYLTAGEERHQWRVEVHYSKLPHSFLPIPQTLEIPSVIEAGSLSKEVRRILEHHSRSWRVYATVSEGRRRGETVRRWRQGMVDLNWSVEVSSASAISDGWRFPSSRGRRSASCKGSTACSR
jgi:hypothetical protein